MFFFRNLMPVLTSFDQVLCSLFVKLHLPPLRFHCVGGCRDWTLGCCRVLNYSQRCYNNSTHIPKASIYIHVVYCMQVCVPTLKTECVNDQVKDGLKLYQEEACYTVSYHYVLWRFSSGRYVLELELDRYMILRSRAATSYTVAAPLNLYQ